MVRVALVTNVLANYRVPCFKTLAQRLQGRMSFYFLTKDMVHRRYIMPQSDNGFRPVWLNGWKWHKPPSDDKHLNDIMPITRSNPDVIVLSGWDEPTYLLLWVWGVLRRKKVIFWIESTSFETVRRGIKERYKRFLVRHAAACIVPGKRAFDYCLKLGMRAHKIFLARNAANHDYFNGQLGGLGSFREGKNGELETKAVTLLFVGRLVEQYKNVSTLIMAYQRIVQKDDNANLLIVGDGPDRGRYEEMVKNEGISGIRFLGELNHDELCNVYAAADVLVLPSRSETWGFVLNEGMEFGLPLVISEAVGAGPDLVHPGENGFVFPVGDSEKLAEILELMVRDESLRRRMGQASKRIIQDFTPEAWAQGVVKAIEAVMGKAVNSS